MLDDYRKVNSKVREELDLNNPLTPLSALRSVIDKGEERRYKSLMVQQLAEVLHHQAAKAAAHAERSKSTGRSTSEDRIAAIAASGITYTLAFTAAAKAA